MSRDYIDADPSICAELCSVCPVAAVFHMVWCPWAWYPWSSSMLLYTAEWITFFFKTEWCFTVCLYPIVFVCSSLMDGWGVSVSWLLWYEVSKIVKFKEARASLMAQMVKNPPVMHETQVWALSWEDPLEKRMVTHLSILAWRIPWTEQHGGLQSMGSQRVRHKWVTDTFMEAKYIVVVARG